MPLANTSRTPADEPAHDVLAAEAFAVPAPDPELRHGPVVLPDDPTGIAEPHDILAAEEFAMPAVRSGEERTLAKRATSSWRLWVVIAAAAVGALFALWRALGP